LYEDEFINVTNMSEAKMREGYKRIYDSYRPGPVVDFRHWPAFFSYHHPNSNSGQTHAQRYGGPDWRAQFSSAAPLLVPGSENYTLDQCGAEGMAERGSKDIDCGAKRMRYDDTNFPTQYNGFLRIRKPQGPMADRDPRAVFNEQIRKNAHAELEEYKRATVHADLIKASK
ncbi:MAG: hypothetical protein VX278_13205, partial [Myxococcota bacterium]|nr:hypothetical protein [Myxococcota bacterium]